VENAKKKAQIYARLGKTPDSIIKKTMIIKVLK